MRDRIKTCTGLQVPIRVCVYRPWMANLAHLQWCDAPVNTLPSADMTSGIFFKCAKMRVCCKNIVLR